MPRARVMLLTLALWGCSAGSGAPSLAPTLSNAAASAAPATVAPIASAPGPSAPCVDKGQLADSADTVGTELQGVIDALKIPNTERALSLSGSAATGLRSIADFVSPAQPEAAKDFRSAASALDSATSAFPGGASLVEQAQTEMATGLKLARTAGC